jgi:hypothetical protein
MQNGNHFPLASRILKTKKNVPDIRDHLKTCFRVECAVEACVDFLLHKLHEENAVGFLQYARIHFLSRHSIHPTPPQPESYSDCPSFYGLLQQFESGSGGMGKKLS